MRRRSPVNWTRTFIIIGTFFSCAFFENTNEDHNRIYALIILLEKKRCRSRKRFSQ